MPAAASDAQQGQAGAEESSPTLLIVGKRLRALKKRLRNLDDLVAKKADGKPLHPDQVRRLRNTKSNRRSCYHREQFGTARRACSDN